MEELLRAIEELKRAYKASGVFNVEVCLWGDHEAVNIVRDDGTEVSKIELTQQKPLTNGEWLRSLSDEEFVHQIWLLCHNDFGTHWLCDEVGNKGCAAVKCNCVQCRLAWLRAEHKGVE